MKKINFSIFALTFVLITNVFGQKPSIELAFDATWLGQYAPLTSVIIQNLTKGCDTSIVAPENILVLNYAMDIPEMNGYQKSTLTLSQNYPNPFRDKTDIDIYLPCRDYMKINVYSFLGQEVAFYENTLESGHHSFTFYSGNEKNYMLTASVEGVTKSIKMVNFSSHSEVKCNLVYSGMDQTTPVYKSKKEISVFEYSLGDTLRFIGYALSPGFATITDVIEDAPVNNKSYTFEALEGIICPGTPTVNYEGNIYSTVLIGYQCWLKENLNAGVRLDGQYDASDNGLIEKYCYNDETANCDTYGGLYQWNELMEYTNQQGTQGICPDGWHIPTQGEWTLLSCTLGGSGVAGGKMKEIGISHWLYPNDGATNESGFTALPGGLRGYGNFYNLGTMAAFWSSTQYNADLASLVNLNYDEYAFNQGNDAKFGGLSVRCVKDSLYWSCGNPFCDIHDGKFYNSVEIGTQCWMQENLNIGTLIQETNNQTNNGLIEKYCYDNVEDNCEVYGGLYQWYEMMQYNAIQGAIGICPEGWHIPTDSEWCTVTKFIDPTVNCDATGNSGTDAGLKMKSTNGWNNGGNGTNESGFTALATGYLVHGGGPNVYFSGLGDHTRFWSSTMSPYDYTMWTRGLAAWEQTISRITDYELYGYSVRCLKD